MTVLCSLGDSSSSAVRSFQVVSLAASPRSALVVGRSGSCSDMSLW